VVRFCPSCGARVISGARFCVECGESLVAFDRGALGPGKTSAAAQQSAAPGIAPVSQRATTLAQPASLTNIGFLAVFGAILAVGAAVAFLIMRQLPQREQLLASAPVASPAAQDGRQLPADHPKIELPKEALDFIAQLEQKTRANPNDIANWNRLGDVSLRAAMFEPFYYSRAEDAYAHALKLDPDNLDALRGIGNIDFDQRKFDEAIAAYEHYLSRRPDDPDVRTDLGTMLLSTGVADQAVNQYIKVLATHPKFFEAKFYLGVAYSQMNNAAGARSAFDQALKLAPDDAARNRVNEMLTALNGVEGAAPGSVASGAMPKAPAAVTSNAVSAANTFKGALERMLRDLPIAGPKVQSVRWTSATSARVMMDNFPMEQMPPFAATKFMTDLRAGIDQVKTAHKISAPVELDIADAASGRVMKSVTE
jgi:cytochrome c-type biogenesis protein CcmH/NrfG